LAQTNVDVKVAVRGEGDLDKLLKRMNALEKEVGQLTKKLPAAANGIRDTGRAAKGAAAGVTAFGAALKSAVAPLTLVLGSVTSLTAGFQVLASQNFAEAKFRSLGGDSEALTKNLKALSRELQGQASTVELTGAAYDVASAGFIKASDATKVLKASSLGATGGFSDINTVANATTSVLNAYGLSADKAGRLVDGFIQTQNDGKIVIGEYAQNIGKLAPIAASLGVPLEDINGAIAAVTANGVNAEIGITALRSALAKLGANSKDATEILAGYGVQINATTIGQEGLLKTLEKLSKVTDKTDLLKIIGTEAGQAIAPLLNDLGKLERLIANQGNVAGVAAAAQKQAAQTIQGAWTEVSTAFSNLFSEQSELAESLIPILQGVADAVNALNSPMGRVVLQVGLVTAGFIALKLAVKALIATSFVQWFLPIVGAVKAGNLAFAAFILKTKALTLAQAALNTVMSAGPWALLAGGLIYVGKGALDARTKIDALEASLRDTTGTGEALKAKMQETADKIETLKGQLDKAGPSADYLRKKIELLTASLLTMQGRYEIEILMTGNSDLSGLSTKGYKNTKGGLTYTVSGVEYNAATGLPVKPKAKPKPVFTPSGGGSSGGGGGGGGGGGAAPPRESELPQLQRQLEVSDKLLQNDRARLEAQFQGNEKEIQRLANVRALLELDGKLADIRAEEIPVAEQKVKEQLAENEAALAGLEIKYQGLELDKQRTEAVEGILGPLDEEIQILQGRINGNEEEIRQKLEILRITNAIKEANPNADTSGVAAMVKQRDELTKQAEAADKLKAQYKSLAEGVAGELTGAFKSIITGSKSAEEALSDAFAGIADAFLDMALKMIAQWLVMKAMGMMFPGASAASDPSPIASLGQSWSSFAGGGYTGDGPRSGGVDGQGGFPAILHPQEYVYDGFADARNAMGGSSDASSEAFAENTNSISTTNSYMRERSIERENQISGGGASSMVIETQVINSVEYATIDQVQKASAASAKQARAQVFNDMKNKPSRRAMVGLK
jgi:TP901 family phage tail tape measure protein